MKLLILSDLHLEFAPYIPNPAIVELADVVVLAGDIDVGHKGIAWARHTFGDKPIVYVTGNHEFYDGDWNKTLAALARAGEEHGVHFLENRAVQIQGIRFLGCTLWTDFKLDGRERRSYAMREAEQRMADYRAIEARPLDEVYWTARKHRLTALHTLKRHRESRAWLEAQLQEMTVGKTVVVTHHLPHHLSVAPKYAGDPLNAAYASDLPPELLVQADLWIHGHTHDSAYYFVNDGTRGQTRVTCNPRGYPVFGGSFENDDFDPDYLIDV